MHVAEWIRIIAHLFFVSAANPGMGSQDAYELGNKIPCGGRSAASRLSRFS